jgi:hypothetical protein
VTGAPYWPGWDIARGIALMPDGTGGVVVDGFGGLHPFGVGGQPAPTVSGGPYWPGWDIVRGIAIRPDALGGYVLDGYGGMHPFRINGSPLPAIFSGGPYWRGVDIARGASIVFQQPRNLGSPPELGGYISDAFGTIYPFGEEGPLGLHGSSTFSMPPSVGNPTWPGRLIGRGVSAYTAGFGGYTLDGFGGLHPFVFPGLA